MSNRQPRLKKVALEAAKDPQRSTLFHWLGKHHVRLAPTLSARRIDWRPLVEAAVRAGVTDGKGMPPTARTLRRTWREVCIDKNRQASAASAKPPRKLQPRDMPKDWRPTPITSAPEQVPAGNWQQALSPYVGPITSGPNMPEPDYTGMDEADRKIARMQWAIRKRG